MTLRALQIAASSAVIALFAIPSSAAGPGVAPDLHAHIDAFIRERSPLPPTRIEIPPLALVEELGIDLSQVEVRLSVPARTRMRGSVPVTVSLRSRDGELARHVVTVFVAARTTALVASRRVARGARLRPEHLKQIEIEASSLPADAILEPSALLGERVRRTVAQGAIWRQRLVETPPAVERGDLVTLVVVGRGLRIEARGKAREDGAVGELIRVSNVHSRRELVGRIGEDGAVYVEH